MQTPRSTQARSVPCSTPTVSAKTRQAVSYVSVADISYRSLQATSPLKTVIESKPIDRTARGFTAEPAVTVTLAASGRSTDFLLTATEARKGATLSTNRNLKLDA